VAATAARVLAAGRRPVLLAADPDPGARTLAALGVRPRAAVDLRTGEDQRLLTRRPDGGAALRVAVWLGDWPG
jgi:hypothetical protein